MLVQRFQGLTAFRVAEVPRSELYTGLVATLVPGDELDNTVVQLLTQQRRRRSIPHTIFLFQTPNIGIDMFIQEQAKRIGIEEASIQHSFWSTLLLRSGGKVEWASQAARKAFFEWANDPRVQVFNRHPNSLNRLWESIQAVHGKKSRTRF